MARYVENLAQGPTWSKVSRAISILKGLGQLGLCAVMPATFRPILSLASRHPFAVAISITTHPT